MISARGDRGAVILGAAILALVLTLAVGAQSASASAVWQINSLANTTFAPGGVINYNVVVQNVGDVPAPAGTGGDANNCVSGSPPPSDPTKCVVVRADFPAQLTPLEANTHGGPACTVQGSSIVCPYAGNTTATQFSNVGGPAPHPIEFSARLNAGVTSGTVTSSFQVSGGEASNVGNTVDPTLVSATPPSFGIDGFDALTSSDAAGDLLTQAGAHPYDYTTSIAFNTVHSPSPLGGDIYPVGSTRDVIADLPAGFVGDSTAADRCTAAQLTNGPGVIALPECPSTSQVGTVLVLLNVQGVGSVLGPLPVYNMVPPPNVPARLGFNVSGSLVTLDASVRTGGDYGLRASVKGITELRVAGTQLTLWGVPADPVHDGERACPGIGSVQETGISCPSGAPLKAFLRNPTSCTAPGEGLLTTVAVDSWENPGVFVHASTRSHLAPGFPTDPSEWGAQEGITGCDKVPFTPSFDALPAASAHTAAPSSLSVDLSLPQSSDPSTVDESDLRSATVTLPAGVRVNPSSAQGLGACTPAQIKLESEAEPECPDDSKVGTVTVETPLLAEQLNGSVYVASPHENPFGSLLAVYLVIKGAGVTVKLAGHVEPDPTTGQLTTVVENIPQLPFSHMRLQFEGGPAAPLVMPETCGTYTSQATLTGWSGKTVQAPSEFTLTNDGAACPTALPFAPALTAGSVNPIAGGNTPFDLQLTRTDADQQVASISSLTLPAGLVGAISSVPVRCSDAQAAAAACPAGSRVGNVTVGAGAGPDPFYITDGNAYLTGPYKGAPVGLAFVVHAAAGPFDLGMVVVRAAIQIDPHTAQVRVISDPSPRSCRASPYSCATSG